MSKMNVENHEVNKKFARMLYNFMRKYYRHRQTNIEVQIILPLSYNHGYSSMNSLEKCKGYLEVPARMGLWEDMHHTQIWKDYEILRSFLKSHAYFGSSFFTCPVSNEIRIHNYTNEGLIMWAVDEASCYFIDCYPAVFNL